MVCRNVRRSMFVLYRKRERMGQPGGTDHLDSWSVLFRLNPEAGDANRRLSHPGFWPLLCNNAGSDPPKCFYCFDLIVPEACRLGTPVWWRGVTRGIGCAGGKPCYN